MSIPPGDAEKGKKLIMPNQSDRITPMILTAGAAGNSLITIPLPLHQWSAEFYQELRVGTILAEAVNNTQGKQLLKMISFYDQNQVAAQPHSILNSSKGHWVFIRELHECYLDEINKERKDSFVTDAVVRITRIDVNKQTPTLGQILTFSLSHPPKSIKAR
ncbi:hypothetical protein J6590_100251 [Homalodisca vitripennis]|nr:hypothetical protein J6590_100251 [Homalodisca vitripennis]